MSYEFNPVEEDEHGECRHEIQRLNQWIADLQSGMYVNCVYCGHRYGPGETTPVSMADALKAHIEECPKHPMSDLRQENASLHRTLTQAVGLIDDLLLPDSAVDWETRQRAAEFLKQQEVA